MRICFLPIIPWNEVVFQRPHQLSVLMAEDGHDVSYVHAHHTSKRGQVQSTRVRDNIFQIGLPFSQYHNFRRKKGQTDAIIRWIKKLKPELLFVNAAYWADVAIAIKKETDVRLVYDILDYICGFVDLTPHEQRLTEAHDNLILHADCVTHSAMSLKPKQDVRTIFIPNACDFDWWNRERAPTGKVGFLGVQAQWWWDEPVAALKKAKFPLEFYGPGTTGGKIPYQDAPEKLRHWSCALIPFKDTPLSQHINPVKLYEYMALGLPIVVSDRPTIRATVEEIPELGRPTVLDDPERWPEAVREAIATDSDSRTAARKKWASENTWRHRYEKLRGAFQDD